MINQTHRQGRNSHSRHKTRFNKGESTSNRRSHFSRSGSATSHAHRSAGIHGGDERPAQFGRHPRSGNSNTHFKRGGPRGQKRGGRKMPTFDPSQFINRNPVSVAEEIFRPKHSFATFGLDGRLVRTIIGMGISSPTPIQDEIIPHILKGHDVVGLAETGTGKTAAFLAPILHKTLSEYSRVTLILAPTRELALQIEAELKKLAHGLKIHSAVCVGGMNIGPQIRALRNRNHFIIGTPGRILDLIERGMLHPERVTTVILDEADRMLDMGFINDIRKIVRATPRERETLFFSATMTHAAEALVDDFLKDPVTVSVKKKDVTNSIEQDVVRFEHHAKFETLTNLLADPAFTRVIIFGAMKHSVEKLGNELDAHGIKTESIHGNKNHSQRQRALSRFKSGQVRVLVATDVAARGIHVDNVSHVINYDLPSTFEDYVHRIGRTGRGSKRGKALTFVSH